MAGEDDTVPAPTNSESKNHVLLRTVFFKKMFISEVPSSFLHTGYSYLSLFFTANHKSILFALRSVSTRIKMTIMNARTRTDRMFTNTSTEQY